MSQPRKHYALVELSEDKVAKIEKSAKPLPFTNPTIETADRSVRYPMANIHRAKRT